MIKLEQLTKIFDTAQGRVVAADHIDMAVGAGEICVLLGPSGCGKTTTLKMINRIVMPTSGRVILDGKDTTGYDTVELRRMIGYVIQQIGLFPNMTVEENIAVLPRMLGWDAPRTKARTAELLDMVALDPTLFMKRYPRELSGGQQQRVGVARALAADPPVMLMDEPFGAIDPINREVIQDEFLKMQERLRKTILFVSHDINEAVKMGDKIAIFRSGKLEQFDTPDRVLAHPANEFIADFVGDDRTLKRLSLVKVREVMERGAPSVREGDSLASACALMQERGLDRVVLVGADGKARGTVHLRTAQAHTGPCGPHAAPMDGAVHLNADLREAVSLMFTHELSWLPCVDDAGALAGFITQHGITRMLGQTYRDSAPAASGAIPAAHGSAR